MGRAGRPFRGGASLRMSSGISRGGAYCICWGTIFTARRASIGWAEPRGKLPVNLLPRPAHFPPRAKSVIHLFMNGGPSQMDLFDPKPSSIGITARRISSKIAGEVENRRPPRVPDAQPLQVRAAWSVRHVGLGRAAASGPTSRRPGAHSFDVHDKPDARTGDLS